MGETQSPSLYIPKMSFKIVSKSQPRSSPPISESPGPLFCTKLNQQQYGVARGAEKTHLILFWWWDGFPQPQRGRSCSFPAIPSISPAMQSSHVWWGIIRVCLLIYKWIYYTYSYPSFFVYCELGANGQRPWDIILKSWEETSTCAVLFRYKEYCWNQFERTYHDS
jgi:hypothetical protein